MKKKLNFNQARWAQILIVYNFEIFYRSSDKNSANNLSRRFNYEKVSKLNTKLLLTLQNKLMLLSNEESLTQNDWKNSVKLTFVLQLAEMLISIDAKLVELIRNRRKILA